MARRASRADRVLESRHLIGLFIGVVVLCSVFFSLGYVMGRSQYAGAVQAAYNPLRPVIPAIERERAQPKEDTLPPVEASGTFTPTRTTTSFEKPALAAKDPTPEGPFRLPPIASLIPPSFAWPVRASRSASRPAALPPPRMLGNNLVLQIAAVTHQSDALAMADVLQRKRFPSFVVAPSGDDFYRVQVGPYPDERAAESAKSARLTARVSRLSSSIERQSLSNHL